MKQSLNVTLESINIGKITLKGIHVEASCEYAEEEMRAEADVFSQCIETISKEFGWYFELAKRGLEIELRNKEMLSKSLEKQIANGTCEAYGPRGWSIRHESTVSTAPRACDKQSDLNLKDFKNNKKH